MKFILNNPTQETKEIISSLENLDYLYVYGDFEGLHYNYLPKVDLGLPSGLKWAKCNVGAENETDPGFYFAWGETDGHEKNSRYKFSDANYTSKGLDAISTDLTLSQDAANVRLGGDWRMPTKTEFEELFNNTNVTWTTINGVNGCKFTNKTDESKYIFMPAAGVYIGAVLLTWGSNGRYLSSTFNSSSSAYNFHFNSSSQKIENISRSNGFTVRGVCDAPDINVSDLPEGAVDLGLSVKWSSCNIGANSPCESGLLFQFGRVDGYAYGSPLGTSFEAKDGLISTSSTPPTESGKTYAKGEVLDPADDAAYVATNGKMRMPTVAEIDELLSGTTNQWCQCTVLGADHTSHNVYGRLFTSKTNTDAKIFIPAAGYFNGNGSFNITGSSGYVLSSSVYTDDVNRCYNLYFSSSDCNRYDSFRYSGLSVRGVCK